jgi:hypothetical protein
MVLSFVWGFVLGYVFYIIFDMEFNIIFDMEFNIIIGDRIIDIVVISSIFVIDFVEVVIGETFLVGCIFWYKFLIRSVRG